MSSRRSAEKAAGERDRLLDRLDGLAGEPVLQAAE